MKQVAVKDRILVLDTEGVQVQPNRWRGKIKTLQKAGRKLTGVVPTTWGAERGTGSM